MAEPKDSFGRCVAKPKFIDRFYEIFLASSPEIKPRFAHTDFAKQKDLLQRGLTMMVMYDGGSETAKMTLDRIGESHSRRGGINIPPNLYRFWIESLIKTISEFDPKFSPEVESAWRHVIQKGVDYITAKY